MSDDRNHPRPKQRETINIIYRCNPVHWLLMQPVYHLLIADAASILSPGWGRQCPALRTYYGTSYTLTCKTCKDYTWYTYTVRFCPRCDAVSLPRARNLLSFEQETSLPRGRNVLPFTSKGRGRPLPDQGTFSTSRKGRGPFHQQSAFFSISRRHTSTHVLVLKNETRRSQHERCLSAQ